MEERRNDAELNEIKCDIKEVKALLMGNGKIGVAEMARRAFSHTEQMRASKNGLMDWTFRIGISILLTFVALKVGLK